MTNYTLTELQALYDADLNALAAELRGFSNHPLAFSLYDVDANGRSVEVCEKVDWRPATDRNQSGELLRWASESGVNFWIDFDDTPGVRWSTDQRGDCHSCQFDFATGYSCGAHCECDCHEEQPDGFVPGNDARAEALAFCAAMLAMKGGLQ